MATIGFEEDRDAYTAGGVFWVPEKARWDYIAEQNFKVPLSQPESRRKNLTNSGLCQWTDYS